MSNSKPINTTHSCLTDARRSLITSKFPEVLDLLKMHRKEHMKVAVQRPIDLTVPAWARVSPGPPNSDNSNSYRFCIGFQNVGCKYRERDKLGLGCLNCGYYARTAFGDVDTSVIVDQFKMGLQKASEETTGFNSIEFLNDGSFLNREEFDCQTQRKLLKIVAKMPRVERVLIESKPEYVEADSLQFVLEALNENQSLEIGIGLESANDFIRDICINKGITLEDFERAITQIAEMQDNYRCRLGVVSYILVKPAFLTHREAIEDVSETLRYLHNLRTRYNIPIIPKLEPAAIADGTILSLLHRSGDEELYYEPLNYWAVLEIIARFGRNVNSGAFDLRVGAREDMDDVLKAPAIYAPDGETFEPFDFVVYEAIQRFNQHGNLFRLFAVIAEVYLRFQSKALNSIDSPLQKWINEKDIGSCAIIDFIEENEELIRAEAETPETKYDIDMMAIVYGVLDIIEGYSDSAIELKNAVDAAFSDNDISKLETTLERCFGEVSPESIVKVKVIAKQLGICAELFFDVTDLLTSEKFSIWSRFYLKNV